MKVGSRVDLTADQRADQWVVLMADQKVGPLAVLKADQKADQWVG